MEDGEKHVLNKTEIMVDHHKQEMIREALKEWILKDLGRREELCRVYNGLFNSIRPQEYDGNHIRFSGKNPEITMIPYQKNALAHILYGGNTLLSHCVGAGETFEMVVAGMESKRQGLSNKNLYVVPNHLTEQWAAIFCGFIWVQTYWWLRKRILNRQTGSGFASKAQPRIITGSSSGIRGSRRSPCP